MIDTHALTPNKAAAEDANRDPLSGEPGAHPIGVGVGAAAGGMAVGAAVGVVAGPVGMAVGAALGAIAGGLVGKSAGELVDPTAEGAYWEKSWRARPYVRTDETFDDYGPAYLYGAEAARRGGDRAFEDMAADLGAGWDAARGTSRLSWEEASHATRDAWERARQPSYLRESE